MIDVCIVVSVLLFLVAAITDVATRTIPNSICVGLLLTGGAARIFDHTIDAALIAAIVVFLFCVAVWFFKLFGGGDAKLLSASALVVPTGGVFDMVLVTALLGGVLSVIYIVGSRCLPPVDMTKPVGRVGQLLRAEQQRMLCRESLPYGVAIGLGSIFIMLRH